MKRLIGRCKCIRLIIRGDERVNWDMKMVFEGGVK